MTGRGLVIAVAQKLKELISTMSASLGSTPEGSAWCLKALHPSDAMVTITGVPDESAMSTVMMNYQTVFTLTVPAGSGSWDADVQLTPHPVQFARYLTARASGIGISAPSVGVMNSQLSGATHSAKFNVLTDLASAWRLAYYGCTVELDAPALSNQGAIAVCQKPVKPAVFCPTAYTAATGAGCGRPMHVWNADAWPSFPSIQATPNAYLGLAKEGAYVPLKLSRTSQRWTTTADSILINDDAILGGGEPIDEAANVFIGPAALGYLSGTNGPAMFPGMTLPYARAAPLAIVGQVTTPLLNEYVADICLKGLAEAAQVRFFFRVGIEMLVPPLSSLSSQLRVSPAFDPKAFEAYFHVSRQLKDGYPAEFNSLDKLWNVIESAASTVGPALSMIPVYGKFLGPIAEGAAALARYAKAPSGGGKQKQLQSAVAQEAASSAMHAAVAAKQRGGRRGGQQQQKKKGSKKRKGRRGGGESLL